LNVIQLYILTLLCFICFIIPKQSDAQAAIGGSGRLMNLAIIEMEREQYEKANDYFRQIIEKDMNIPREMPYYFAKTLFHLGQYDNSNNFLNKYLSINGFKGDNYEAAIQLQTALEEPLKAIKNCEFCDIRGYAYETCIVCEGKKHVEQNCSYCKGKGIVGCSRCAGKGMITKKNIFNITEYFECERCSGNGRLTCPVCEGKKSILSNCSHCQGMGKLSGEQICDHNAATKPRHLSSKFQQLIELNSHN
jgi:tetratricopeptide (TPR) repeat protein